MRMTHLQWIFIRCHQSFIVSPSFDQCESADFARCVRQCKNYILKIDSIKNHRSEKPSKSTGMAFIHLARGCLGDATNNSLYSLDPNLQFHTRDQPTSNWFFVCFASSVASNLCTVAVRPVSPFVTNCCSLSSSFTVTASNYFSAIDFYSHIFLFQRFCCCCCVFCFSFIWSVFALRSDKIVVLFCRKHEKMRRKKDEKKWNEMNGEIHERRWRRRRAYIRINHINL